MTLQEANALLDAAIANDEQSRINQSMTRAEAIEIVRKGIQGPRALSADGVNLDPLMEKRVYQVARNQRRPRY